MNSATIAIMCELLERMLNMPITKILGRVLDVDTQAEVERLRVEAWDRQSSSAAPLATTITNEQGQFDLQWENPQTGVIGQLSGIYFKVFDGNKLLKSTDEAPLTITRPPIKLKPELHLRKEIIIEVRMSPPSHGRLLISVRSLEEMRNIESEIVKRISETQNGGLLFIFNPLRLLSDIGVELSDQARQEFLKEFPHTDSASSPAYNALRISAQQQRVTVNIGGIFKGGNKP